MKSNEKRIGVRSAVLLALFFVGAYCSAALAGDMYRLQAGDKLAVAVWGEEKLQQEVLVQPDGAIAYPLAGRVEAKGLTTEELRSQLTQKLAAFIPEPEVTVTVINTEGNRIFVTGQTQRPGMFLMSNPMDVMQALSLAGGFTPFADRNDIRILRRNPVDGSQTTIEFSYDDVVDGDNPNGNIVLQSGDVVVVP